MKEGGRKQGAATPCAACKLLRRRCAQDCVFAPYFPADEPQKFASVHKVFGASNVNKMLQVQFSCISHSPLFVCAWLCSN
ncbi:LOB domain-containing protein 4 [Actinidia rufa]|uniref:LOB domain-containing protein 4 n=1 Tax=Actinidia rufa TaxID=165716 RepID=A0A7J0G4S1_9ERIC|nr:LOB domain-containing protein 4 [Actinidia rufa]